VAFAPDGTLATSREDGVIQIWHAGTGELLQTLQDQSFGIMHIAYSPDGKTLASASFDHSIKLWDVVSGRELRTLLGHSDWVTCVAFSPDGGQLASSSQDQTVRLWNAQLPTEQKSPH
jgi:WD40 repeat protein